MNGPYGARAGREAPDHRDAEVVALRARLAEVEAQRDELALAAGIVVSVCQAEDATEQEFHDAVGHLRGVFERQVPKLPGVEP